MAAASGSTGIAFQGSRYFKISGTGDSRYQYGIRISQTGSGISGLNITAKSSDCEVNNLEVFNTGFAGIMIKTDPTCDPSTQRANFTMYNVYVHHNYVHDTTGEGFYIGNSFWNEGQARTCNGQSVKLLPHNIIGLEISYNRVENSGCEGIQYACAPNSRVHHNTVYNAGIKPFDAYQDNGVQIGGGVSGYFYNNVIRKAQGMGLIVVGHLGPNYIYNNVIAEARDKGIFVDERTGSLPNVLVQIANNTVATSVNESIQLYNETQTTSIVNTALLAPGNGKFITTLNNTVRYTSQNVFQSLNVADAKLVNPAAGDFHIMAGSPLIDKGQSLASYGIVTDLDDVARPQGGAYDISAYEYKGTTTRARQGALAEPTDVVTVQAYPSPTVNQLTVRLSNDELITELNIVDGTGRTVTQHVPGAPAAEVTIPVHQLGSGLYIIRVGTALQQYGGRFLKQ